MAGDRRRRRDPDKIRKFVIEYMIDFNGARAARDAGFSARSAKEIAYELLQDPQVQAELLHQREALSRKLDVKLEDVVSELRRIGFSRIDEVLQIDGEQVIGLREEISEDAMRAISSIEQTKDVLGGGDDDMPITRVKLRIRLHDKLGALLALGKHVGLKEKVTHEHEVSAGAKVNIYLPDNGRRTEKA